MTDIAFFITGMGRSGTKWLATLLNEAEGVHCYHEPLKRGVNILSRGYLFTVPHAVAHLQRRKLQMHSPDGERWGEVNSYLRYWVDPLREVFPDVPILGLVRDGKDTVASLMRRSVYGPRDRRILPRPPADAEGQFAKCCWYWADAYERLLKQGVDIFRLEALNESYLACEALYEELGVKIAQRVWKRYAGRKIHVDKRAPKVLNWTTKQEDIFERWAGDIYEEVGYEAG
jgi:hypothetical protein